jgi:hypothetical protein
MDPTIEDPDADAQFAAFVADLRAHADDPLRGVESRELLSEDSETLRAAWDLAGAMAASQATPPPFAFVVYALVLAVVALAVGVLVVTKVGYLL